MHTRPERAVLPIVRDDFSTGADGLLVTGPDRRIIFGNAAFKALTGFADDDFVGKPLDFNHARDAGAEPLAAIERAVRRDGFFSGRVRNLKKSGEPFWNDFTVFARYDDNRGYAGDVGIVRAVVGGGAAANVLIGDAERLFFLLDCIQSGIAIFNPRGEILLANAAATKLLGAGAQRTHEDGSRLAPTDDPVARAVAGRSVVTNVVLGLERAGGNPRWLLCNAYPVLDESGEPTEVVLSLTEITELKAAERALQKSDARLRLVLAGSRDAPWDWDMISGEMYYSPRWWTMLGFEAGEASSDAQLWIRRLHPDDRQRVAAEFKAALEGDATSYELEYRLCRKDSSFVPILSRGFILRDNDGTAVRVAGTNTDLTERKVAEEQISKLALYDPLTGLPNRRLLMQELAKAIRASSRGRREGALFFIDLDNFKVINDTLGHDFGDQLLQLVAQRLLSCVRETDTVARLGGDEFIVMLEHLPTDSRAAGIEAERIARKILATLNAPYAIAGRQQMTTASIGVVLFSDCDQGVETLLKRADLAMYEAKTMGRNTLRYFDAGMQAAADERLACENDLRRMVPAEELQLYFQPQVSAADIVIGAEVLLRWQNPRRGLVLPEAFIPLAETTGLIVPISAWLLRAACAQLAAWAAHPLFGRLSLSVNVSGRQFREPNFAVELLDVIAQTGADPAKLKLEMTENLLTENVDDIAQKMALLRGHGVSFSLDDFGTGYSSLKDLQLLPFSELKIDRTFVDRAVTNPSDASITRAIITLAGNLDLSVIAEGVESDPQRTFLFANGCHIYQGSLFGAPVALEAFETGMQARAAHPA